MELAGHRSCIVHTTGLPESRILRMLLNDNMPWFTQCRWMISASLNSGRRVISVPMLAMSIWKRFFRRKCRRQNTVQRSQRKFHCFRNDCGSPTTVMSSLCLSRTSIFAFSPLLFSASFNRLAASAAPPVISLVLTISIRMVKYFNCPVQFLFYRKETHVFIFIGKKLLEIARNFIHK